jgi:hypothetical protein
MRQRLHGADAGTYIVWHWHLHGLQPTVVRDVSRSALRVQTDHTDIATSLSNLGTATRNLGNLTEAFRLHTRALAMKRRLYGADVDHREIAATLSSLAAVLCKQVWRVLVVVILVIAIVIVVAVIVVVSSVIVIAIASLSSLLSQGNIPQAMRQYRESLAMLRRLFGADAGILWHTAAVAVHRADVSRAHPVCVQITLTLRL